LSLVLPLADYVYFLQDGRITEQGTYLDLLSQDGDFAKLIDEFGSSDNTNKDENAEKGGRARAKSVAEVGKDAKAELMQEEVRQIHLDPCELYFSDTAFVDRNEQKVPSHGTSQLRWILLQQLMSFP
jgi:ABC-type multidrug transport system ATPase subunit